MHTAALAARIVLLVSLALAWLNLLLTARWAAVPGSVNGPKYPFYLAALLVVSVLAWRATPVPVRMRRAAPACCAAGVAFIAFAFFRWFPLSSWDLIPFLDDWPPRYQSTLEGVRMLQEGALAGWRWGFLGGYPTATDVTQDLTVWAALPMWLFGAARGFHLTHALLFAAIPLLVWLDLRISREDEDLAFLSAGLAALFSANYSYFLIRSGDTNSLTGVVAATAALVAAHGARAGRRGAPLALTGALTLANLSHRGFFVFALVFLAIDAAAARDRRAGVRAGIAAMTALAVSLPLTWDLWRYPAYYIVNNVELHPAAFSWTEFLRHVYYNVELLVLPGRWFNDHTGLTNVFLPVIAYAAWRAPGRPRFYALATLGVVALVRLNYTSFGYAFLRPINLLPVFVAPALAWFVLRCTGTRRLAFALLAMLALYIQVWLVAVPHVRSVREFEPALVDRIASLGGHMVLVENAFHRDVDTDPAGASLPTPFGIHYEALLPEATGKRLYGGMWDGWQWTPYRDQVFANGTFRGRSLHVVRFGDVERELRRWGVRHLLVWSELAREFLGSSNRVALRWQNGRWAHFELVDADDASVSVPRGSGMLSDMTPFGARVALTGVRAGDQVVVRMNYHPAWRAYAGTQPLDTLDAAGQLAFAAPADGDHLVTLVYPRRRWLWIVALGAGAAGIWAVTRVSRHA
jgi:hypothetical protein